MEVKAGARCRRCGAEVSVAAERFTHVLPLRGEHGDGAVHLVMCLPCGVAFATLRDRDEYARLVYFG
jgi:hypothetical protein